MWDIHQAKTHGFLMTRYHFSQGHLITCIGLLGVWVVAVAVVAAAAMGSSGGS